MKNINLALFYTILSSPLINHPSIHAGGSDSGAIAGGVIVVIIAIVAVGTVAIIILIFM